MNGSAGHVAGRVARETACRTPVRRRTGFTLIEVLVVVAIIVLLLAILLPSFLKIRAQSRRVACVSNLHQVMLGWQYYLDSYDGYFPRGPLLNITYGGKQGSESVFNEQEEEQPKGRPLNRFVGAPGLVWSGKAAEIFWCPSDRGGPIGDPVQFSKHYDYYGTSYRTNRYLIGPRPPPWSEIDPCIVEIKEAFLRLGINPETAEIERAVRPEITNASRLVVMGDYGWEDSWNIFGDPPAEWHDGPSTGVRTWWHNIGFMDMHADFIPIRRAQHVTKEYTVIPFKSMQAAFAECQADANF